MSTSEQSRDLFFPLRMKLNANGNSVCSHVKDRNGFEIYRHLSAEYDPQVEGTDIA